MSILKQRRVYDREFKQEAVRLVIEEGLKAAEVERNLAEHRSQYGVEEMCRILSVSRSGFYNRLKRGKSQREQENEDLIRHIRQIYNESHGTYGSPSPGWDQVQ